MNSKPIPVLYFDIVRDFLANFDRKTLCRLQIVNRRFKLIIDKEFNKSPPYLILRGLTYNIEWTITVEKDFTTVPVNLILLQKIIATKFIRFGFLDVNCNEDFHPMQLLDMSHVWRNRRLSVSWTRIENFRPTAELICSFTKCRILNVTGRNAVYFLHGLNSGRCRKFMIHDSYCHKILHKFPWTKISDFLFRPVGCSKRLRRTVHLTIHSISKREKVIEFIDSVKERFAACNVTLKFSFHLSPCVTFVDQFPEPIPEFDIQNKQTKQRLQFVDQDEYKMYTKME